MAENETEATQEGHLWTRAYVAPNHDGLTDEEVQTLGISAINYEPKFDRLGLTRRVLGHITDEDHVGRGPRNTAARLDQELDEDRNTPYRKNVPDPENPEAVVPLKVQEHLDKLVEAGLVEKRDDDTYAVTEAGITELVN
jgi:hypothetical protein